MNNLTFRSIRITALFGTLFLAACSGGGSDATLAPPPVNNPPPVVQKGIEGGGIVNRFGASFSSVTVSDVTFDTTSSSLIATMITQINDLEGTIEAGSIDANAGTFVVLGQTVSVVATTVFDDDISPRSIAGLSDGDAVEVSGLYDGTGVFVATRIEFDDDAGDFEITGVVSNLDTAAARFNIGSLVVDYSQAMLEDFDGGTIRDGDVVEVEGNMLGAAGELIATEVENESPSFDGDDGDFGELEGFITRFVSATDFDVNGFPVTTNAQTVFDDGTAAMLAVGVRVELDGVLDANGVLVASKVDFEDAEDDAVVEMEARVDAVDVSASTLVVLGQTILVGGSTTIVDTSDADLRPFTLADFNVGDFVEINAFIDVDNNNTLTAVLIERDDSDDNEVEVEGPAAMIMSPTLTVAGVSVATDSGTQFELLNDTVVSSAEFFALLTDGTIVEAQGTWDGATLTADELELED